MPGVVKNPVKGIPRKPINNARDRYLNAAEAKRLMAAVEASLNMPHEIAFGRRIGGNALVLGSGRGIARSHDSRR